MFDFSQYDDYRKLQSAESNQSSENFSPKKSAGFSGLRVSSDLEEGMLQ